MAKDVRFVISGDPSRGEAALREFQRTGTDVVSVLEREFNLLGTSSSVAADRQRAAYVAAFDKIKASGLSSYDDIARASQALQSKLAILDKQRGMSALGNDTRQAANESRALENALGGVNNVLGAMGVTLGVAGIITLARDVRQARIEMDAISNSLAAGTQSSALAGLEFDYVSVRANYLGLNLQKTATDYAQLVAASKESSLEGQKTRDIFNGVTTAITALHLPSDKASNVLRALNQMISKGTVQSEELKGQLGEALPGAFQMAAKAMGWTTAELQKHLDKGEVLASDLLPKLAAEMDKRYGKQIPEAIKSTQAEINRLDNAWFKLRLTMADSGMFADAAKGMTGMVEGARTMVMWTGQAKVFWGAMIDKAKVWYDAGGLIGLVSGGAEARAEMKAQFAAIDQMAEHSWNKWAERGGVIQPGGDSKALAAQRQQEIDARAAAAKEAAEKTKQEAEKLMKHELDAFKAHQDSRTAMIRAQKEIELAELKGQYDRGLVSTSAYYEKEKQIALAAAEQELANTKAYLEKETALLANLKGRTKKGEKDPEYVEELAKHEKAIEAVRLAELKLQKTTVDEGEKALTALHAREKAYRDQGIAALEAAAEYVEAEKAKQEAYRRTREYLDLVDDAQKGNAAAIAARAALEKREAADLISGEIKKIELARQYADDIAKMKDEVAALNGEDQERIRLNGNLRDALSKEAQLREKLRVATAAGNRIEIDGLSQEIQYQEIKNQRIREEIELKNRRDEMTGNVVGWNGNTPIYADSYQKEQARTGYISNAQLLGAGSGSSTVTASGNSPFVNLTDKWFSGMNSFDVGTPYVPRDMVAKIHKGERIIPAAQNNAAGLGSITIGDIIVNLPAGTPQQNARETARAIYAELQQLGLRFRAA